MKQSALLLLVLTTFSAASWYLDVGPFHTDLPKLTHGYMFLYAALCILYLTVLKWNWVRPSWRVGAASVFLFSVITPSVSETDQLRYIWDGLVQWQGLNPYRFTPVEIGDFQLLFWSRSINHPELNTIYPPAAQLLFALSAILNPFFWHSYLGLDWAPHLVVTSFWQVELGWKALIGLFASLLVYIFRNRAWHWLILHPLFLTKFIGNGNIDAVMVSFLAASLYMPWFKRSETPQVLLLSAAILTKWMPLVFLPFYFWHWRRKHGLARATSAIALLGSLVVGATVAYYTGSNGRMFESFATYMQHWLFFGYVHRFLADALVLAFGGDVDAIAIAKGVCAVLGLFAGLVLGWRYLAAKHSLRLSIALLSIFFLMLMPTLHPWYLMILLPLGLPYFRVLPSLWLWPLLAFASHSFYVFGEDPWQVRYWVYSIVTIVLVIDISKVLKRHGLKTS